MLFTTTCKEIHLIRPISRLCDYFEHKNISRCLSMKFQQGYQGFWSQMTNFTTLVSICKVIILTMQTHVYSLKCKLS